MRKELGKRTERAVWVLLACLVLALMEPLRRMALKYRVRPSALLNEEDPYTAWCIDEAVDCYDERIRHGETPRPEGADEKPKNNLELIRRIREAQRRGR